MSISQEKISNPFRPGAGHMPPYLAGRQAEQHEFAALLKQRPILKNLVLTGLRGVGKTVLLETFKPISVDDNWLWVGTDLSESASVIKSPFFKVLSEITLHTCFLIPLLSLH